MFDYLDSVNLAGLVAQQYAAPAVLHDERVTQRKPGVAPSEKQGAVASV
jgi:hypothetical protein